MKIKTENLGNMKIFCSETHRFGTDAVLLADFAANGKKVQKACDLGTGCGIVALLMLRDNPKLCVYAIDIQSECVELVKTAVKENGLENRLFPLNCDLKVLPQSMNLQFDLVTMNPPYKKAGAGLMCENEGLNIARFELKCDFNDICKSAFGLLKYGGRFCVCHRPERLTDALCAMRENLLEPKLLQMVCQRKNSEPMLFLLQGTKNASQGIKILPNLFIEDENGHDSEEITRIYKPWLIERDKQNGKR